MSYEFVTLKSYVPGPGAPMKSGDIVERDGYVPIEERVAELQFAGERLEDWNRARFPEDVGPAVPVFMDRVDAAVEAQRIQERFEQYQAERREAERAAGERAVVAREEQIAKLVSEISELKKLPAASPSADKA